MKQSEINIINKPQPGKAMLPVIVVIDHEEQIIISLRSLLRRDKYSIYSFLSPYDALEFLKCNSVDVLITGMRMPEMTGTEFLERTIKICPDSIRLIIGCYEEKSAVLNAISRGLASQYIMMPWDDEQLRSVIIESMELQQNLRQKKLESILLPFKNLPSPPSTHLKLKKLLIEERVSQKKIAVEIEKSPELAANLIRLSNSIFYGARRSILSVFDALTFIGTESVFNIILGLETFNSICSKAPLKTLKRVEGIRTKSVIRAQVAREMALRWSVKINMQEAYIAGLLLDIGLIFRFCYSPKQLDPFYIVYKENNTPLFDADKEIYTITHDQVGEALLKYWNFPPVITNTVANHHSYSGKDNLTTVVQLADMFILGRDSFPHDPYIEQIAPEWESKLRDFMDTVKCQELLIED